MFVHSVVKDWRISNLESSDRALCEFAAKLTNPNHKNTKSDIEKLRESGFDDRAIHDSVQVIGYFNYITRIADSLGVQPDFEKTWG